MIHGKAVFNNKEYGCHLLAKPNGSNVHATSLILSKKLKNTGSCNDLTLGKAVSNNKEYGCHLLAQPKGSNVHATSYFHDPNPNPETEIQIYKSYLCLGVTKIQRHPRLFLIQKQKT